LFHNWGWITSPAWWFCYHSSFYSVFGWTFKASISIRLPFLSDKLTRNLINLIKTMLSAQDFVWWQELWTDKKENCRMILRNQDSEQAEQARHGSPWKTKLCSEVNQERGILLDRKGIILKNNQAWDISAMFSCWQLIWPSQSTESLASAMLLQVSISHQIHSNWGWCFSIEFDFY
jgi:hypothetical protein